MTWCLITFPLKYITAKNLLAGEGDVANNGNKCQERFLQRVFLSVGGSVRSRLVESATLKREEIPKVAVLAGTKPLT